MATTSQKYAWLFVAFKKKNVSSSGKNKKKTSKGKKRDRLLGGLTTFTLIGKK